MPNAPTQTLDDAIFPVDLRPLTTTAPSDDLFQDEAPVKVATHRAVVNLDTRRVVGVVGSAYRLISNSDALDLCRKAFCQYFESVDPSDFTVYGVYVSRSGGQCYIDLIHDQFNFDVWKQETWLPYLRVSNSYNGSRALRFELGFVREACSNGLIFTKETIKVKLNHTRKDLGDEPAIRVLDGMERLKRYEDEFKRHVAQRSNRPLCHVSTRPPLSLRRSS